MTEHEERAELMLDQRDIAEFMTQAGTGRKQPMLGFDEDYTDIVDYIIRCTHKIWEEKAIGLIYTHYSHNIPIYMSDALIYGRDAVVESTVRTLAAFPDARLYGDEVIWCGNERDGFHSSHRITWTAHNLGPTLYGPATGRRIQRRGIAHCVVRENRIVEEWIVRDELALVRQLGFDEVELAQQMAEREAAAGVQPYAGSGEVPRLHGQLHPPIALGGDPHDPDTLPHLIMGEVWNARMLNRLHRYYVPDAVVFASSNRRLEGLGDYTHYILQMLAAFPDGAMNIDHVAWIGSQEKGYKIAVRWTFQGTHRGPSSYGAPSGKRVRLLGISHWEVKAAKVVREYLIFDEFALLKQIHWPS
jgi:predicted ester cyclase